MPKDYFWVFLLVAVVLIGLYHFQTSPGFWFDEGIIAQPAKNIALYGVYGTQVAPTSFFTNNFWITTNFSVVLPIALFLKTFGISIWAARLTPLLYLIGLVMVSYFFIKNLYGVRFAIPASLLLITFPPLYGNGKAILGEVPGLFWLILGGLFYLYFQERKKLLFLMVTALLWGLGMSTKPYYLLFIPGVIFLIWFLWFKQKSINYKAVLLFFFVLSLPLFVWIIFAFDFSSFNDFYTTVSYFLNSYGVSSFEPLKNLFRFVSESTPIHFTVLSVFIFAAWLIQKKEKIKTPSIVITLFIFILLSFLWYLKTPGWYRYFFSVHILAILLFPSAVYVVIRRAGLFLKRESYTKSFSMAIMGSLILFQAGFLFVNYDNFSGNEVIELKRYVDANIADDASIFVASKPEAAFILEQKNLYQYIFINDNLKIGKNAIRDIPIDYMITGRSNDLFIIRNKDLIDVSYDLMHETEHYRIYRLKTQ